MELSGDNDELELGLHSKLIRWIMACITTVSYSIVVNGFFMVPIKAGKGLR